MPVVSLCQSFRFLYVPFAFLGYAVVCEANARLVIVDAPVSSGSDAAFIDCPCIQNETIDSSLIRWDAPENYGTSCAIWDLHDNHPDCSVLEPPLWCSRAWCYVDASLCEREHRASVIFEGMHFSYHTCGDIDLFTEKALAEPPGGFYNGFLNNGLGVWQPSSIAGWDTVVISYSRELLYSIGLNPDSIKHRATSNSSKKSFSSSYTAVVHDIALGHVHFAFYAFWQTSERINFGVSPVPMYPDMFYFWTPKKLAKKRSIWQTLHRPFKPFRWDLWLLIIGTVIFAAMNLLCVEFGFAHICRNPRSIVHCVYEAFMSLFSAALINEYHQPAARVIALGFSIFIVIIIASFTGSTTSHLVGRAVPKFTTFEDVLAKRESICMWGVTRSALEETYPILKDIGVTVHWSNEFPYIFDYMESGACKHGIASENDGGSELSCKFARIGDPLVAIPVGPFVQKDFSNVFNFHHAKLREAGTWSVFSQGLNPQYPCPPDDYEEDNIDEVQLTAEHMLGICVLMMICSAASMMLYLCSLGEKKLEEEFKHQSTLQDIVQHSLHDIKETVAGERCEAAPEEQENAEDDGRATRDLMSRIEQMQMMLQRVEHSQTELKEQVQEQIQKQNKSQTDGSSLQTCPESQVVEQVRPELGTIAMPQQTNFERQTSFESHLSEIDRSLAFVLDRQTSPSSRGTWL